MSPFVGYHATVRRHREGICEYGLLGDHSRGRLFGVYVFRDDCGHRTFSRSRWACRWSWSPPLDLWKVAYIGPMAEDHYVENGYVLLEAVPPENLTLITLVTGNNQ